MKLEMYQFVDVGFPSLLVLFSELPVIESAVC